jgi:hypothetical protein
MEIRSVVDKFFHAGGQTDRQTDGHNKFTMRLICREREICDYEINE